MKITRLDTPHCSVGEGPVWDVQEQALYSIDILGKCIHRHHLASGRNDRFEVPGIIGSMALRVGGGALIALKDGVHTYDFATGASAPLTCPPDQDPRVQVNDGKTDRFGRCTPTPPCSPGCSSCPTASSPTPLPPTGTLPSREPERRWHRATAQTLLGPLPHLNPLPPTPMAQAFRTPNHWKRSPATSMETD